MNKKNSYDVNYMYKTPSGYEIRQHLRRFIVAFIISPVITLVIVGYNCLKYNKAATLSVFAILLAMFASAINITKIPESDQIVYMEQFRSIGISPLSSVFTSLSDGMGIKEPLYSVYVILCYYLFFGSAKLFIFFTSFLVLFFHYKAFINIYRKYGYDSYIVVAGLLALTFFTQYFSLTIHLIRQMLATSISFYAISTLDHSDTSNKKAYIWMIVACFTHSTTIPLNALALVPFLHEDFKFKNLILVMAIGVATGIFLAQLGNMLSFGGDGMLAYAASRAAGAEGLSDTADGEGMSQGLVLLVSVPLLIICLLSYWKKRSDIPPVFVNLCIFICLFVLLTSYSPLIQYRFFFFLYSFILFILPLAFRVNTRISKLFCFSISTFMVVRFAIYLSGDTLFANLYEVLLYPLPVLFHICPY